MRKIVLSVVAIVSLLLVLFGILSLLSIPQIDFVEAAKNGNLPLLRFYLWIGYDPSAPDIGRRTALPEVVMGSSANKKEVVSLLLAHKANTIDGGSRLAAQYGHTDILKLLLQHTRPSETLSPKEYKDFLGEWLVAAATGNHSDCCLILLQEGADIDTPGRYWTNRTALMVSAVGEGTSPDTPKQIQTVKLLLAHKPDLTAVDGDGKTALQLALGAGNRKCAQMIREAGAKK